MAGWAFFSKCNRIKLACLVALTCGAAVTAYPQKTDSLKRLLKNSSGANKFDILYQLAYEYSDETDSISLIYATQAHDLALKLYDSSKIIKSGRIKSAELRRLERFDESIPLASYILGVARRKKDSVEMKMLLTSLAISYTMKGGFDKALLYNLESLAIREQQHDKKEISVALNNLGLNYYKLGEAQEALKYYHRSLKLKKESNDKHDLDRLLINIGLCYNNLGEYKTALKYVNDGLNVCEEKCSDQIVIEGEIALGVTLEAMGSLNECVKHVTKSLEVAKRTHNFRYQAENLVCLGRVSLKDNQIESSLPYLKEAEQISEEKGYKFLLGSAYDLLIKFYYKKNDYKTLSFYQAKYIELTNSLFSNGVISNITHAQTDYEERENRKTIAQRNQLVALQNEIILRQQRQYYLAMAVGGLVLAIACLLFYFNRKLKMTNHQLSDAKNLIQGQKAKLEDYSEELEVKVEHLNEANNTISKMVMKLEQQNQEILKTNEELINLNQEKNNLIGIVAHDLKSPLNQIKGLLSLVKLTGKVDDESKNYLGMMEQSALRLNEMITKILDVEAIESKRMNLKMEEVNLSEMLTHLSDRYKQEAGNKSISIDKNIKPETYAVVDKGYAEEVLENLVSNAIKFSPFERSVFVNLTAENGSVICEIKDQGPGLSDDDKKRLFGKYQKLSARPTGNEISTGLGLSIVKKFVEAMNGQIWCKSELGSGASFFVKFQAVEQPF